MGHFDYVTTFADSTTTYPKGMSFLSLRMYVLARFPEALSFEWVHNLRAKLVKDEIKHQDYRSAVEFRSIDKELQKSVEAGISGATIFVVDPNVYVDEIISKLLEEKAEPGIDFDRESVVRQAAEEIIASTPAYELTNLDVVLEMTDLSSRFGLHGTNPTTRSVPLPEDMLKKVGGTLRAAIRYAARAYSVFDLNEEVGGDEEFFDAELYTYRRKRKIAKMLGTKRIFDTEDAKSLEVLKQIADGIQISYLPAGSSRMFLQEQDSRSADALQAADVAAGAAREIINKQGLRPLASTFRSVFVNGISLHDLLR